MGVKPKIGDRIEGLAALDLTATIGGELYREYIIIKLPFWFWPEETSSRAFTAAPTIPANCPTDCMVGLLTLDGRLSSNYRFISHMSDEELMTHRHPLVRELGQKLYRNHCRWWYLLYSKIKGMYVRV